MCRHGNLRYLLKSSNKSTEVRVAPSLMNSLEGQCGCSSGMWFTEVINVTDCLSDSDEEKYSHIHTVATFAFILKTSISSSVRDPTPHKRLTDDWMDFFLRKPIIFTCPTVYPVELYWPLTLRQCHTQWWKIISQYAILTWNRSQNKKPRRDFKLTMAEFHLAATGSRSWCEPFSRQPLRQEIVQWTHVFPMILIGSG